MTEAIPAALAVKLDDAFTGRWLISHPQAAALLQKSEKTLKKLGDDNHIRFRLQGRVWRVYAREDIEAYVETPPCPSTDQSAPTARSSRTTSNTTSSSGSHRGNVVAFTAQRAREAHES